MDFDIDTFAKIIGPLLSIVVAVFKYYFEGRAKIVSFYGHVSSFSVQGEQQKTTIHTHSVVVRNTGRKPAHNVRLGHSVLPPDVTVFPPVQYMVEQNPEGASEIIIPIMVPKEQVTISYLYFPPLTWNQINFSVKSDEGFAKILNVIPMPQPPKAVLSLIWLLIFIGVSFVFYWLVRLVAYLI